MDYERVLNTTFLHARIEVRLAAAYGKRVEYEGHGWHPMRD